MTALYVGLGLIVLAVLIYLFVIRKSAPSDGPVPAPANPWIVWPSAPWPSNGDVRFQAASTPVVSVTWDRDISKLKVGDVATATVKLNGIAAPIATKCQWAMDTTGVVQMAQSTTTPGLNRLLTVKPGTVRLIALAGGGFSPIMVASVAAVAPPPPPPHVPVMTLSPVPAAMQVGDRVTFVALRDGVRATSGIVWSLGGIAPAGASGSVNLDQSYTVVAFSAGIRETVTVQDMASGSLYSKTFEIHPKPVPIPLPPSNAPAKLWVMLRGWITLMSTNFYYNWDQPHGWTGIVPTAMEIAYAKRYDITYSGDPHQWARLKQVNPNMRCIPYALELTTLRNAGGSPSITTVWENDFGAFCAATAVDPVDEEMAWLHLPGIATEATRLGYNDSGNQPRLVPDPTSGLMRAYTVDRFKRIAATPGADGVFIDEYGSAMSNIYKRSCPTSSAADVARLAEIMAAQVTLLAAIAAAMYPKQLIINTGGYEFQWDADTTHAARGAHMEQTNAPMMRELWANTWPYVDARLAAGDFINMVPLYEFGSYEYLHDGQATVSASAVKPSLFARAIARVRGSLAAAAPVGNSMDTPRGKLCELVSYYMVVTDPKLCGLSIENGNWATAKPTQNYLFQIDADLGLAIEKRARISGVGGDGTAFVRRFERGLVIMNCLSHDTYAGPQNFGAANASVFTLPTDRSYSRVLPDGSVASPSLTVTLRTPEAAIFVVTPRTLQSAIEGVTNAFKDLGGAMTENLKAVRSLGDAFASIVAEAQRPPLMIDDAGEHSRWQRYLDGDWSLAPDVQVDEDIDALAEGMEGVQ